MDIENTETLGLGQMVDRVAELTREGAAGYGLLKVPEAALPPGMVVREPTLLAIRDGEGEVRIESLLPHIEALRGKPVRRKGIATATTLDSFCDLVNRNGDDATLIFVDASWRVPKLTAVLNYSKPTGYDQDDRDGERSGDVFDAAAPNAPSLDDPLARFGDHRVVYAFPLSEPWKLWVEGNGKFMPQDEFAAFIEEHIHEIAAPDPEDERETRWEADFRTRIASPNELVDLARGLEITVGSKMKTRTRLQSGETSLVFETEHRTADGGEVTVPGLFILRVPIFYRGLPQRMLVRLRYRPAGEKGVFWAYEIFRPDEVVDERIRDDVHEVAHKTGRQVVDGAPEA